MAFIHESFVGNPAAACKYLMVCGIDGKLYTFSATSTLSFPSLIGLTVGLSCDKRHSPLVSLHPWRTGLLKDRSLKLRGLCTVTPSPCGWKIVVYPASKKFPTLIKEFCRNAGRTSAFRASDESDGKGNYVVCEALTSAPFGSSTTFIDMPMFGSFSSARIKCEVAPESTIMVEATL